MGLTDYVNDIVEGKNKKIKNATHDAIDNLVSGYSAVLTRFNTEIVDLEDGQYDEVFPTNVLADQNYLTLNFDLGNDHAQTLLKQIRSYEVEVFKSLNKWLESYDISEVKSTEQLEVDARVHKYQYTDQGSGNKTLLDLNISNPIMLIQVEEYDRPDKKYILSVDFNDAVQEINNLDQHKMDGNVKSFELLPDEIAIKE